jgi:hypothetical protein
MDLNTAIKKIVQEYIANETMADLVYGTWGGSSVKIDDKPVPIPIDMIDVPKGVTVTIGERVTLLQKYGGQKYAVIGVL